MPIFRKAILFLVFYIFLFSFLKAQGIDVQRFLQNKVRPIGTNDAQDFKPLKKYLRNKRIVLLGEFTHGAKDINQTKNQLIQYLHEELGYHVLLVESGIGELAKANHMRPGVSAEQMLSAGVIGPWRTQEYLDLMKYLDTNLTLEIAGFDVQKSGQGFAEFAGTALNLINEKLLLKIKEVEATNNNFIRNLSSVELTESFYQQKKDLIKTYGFLVTELEKFKHYKYINLIQRTLQNRIDYINYYTRFRENNDHRERWRTRDSIMAANILWLIDEVYPNEKIIISGHNFHIAKYNEKEEVMGEFLKEKLGKNALYSIGIFGGTGEYANNSGKAEVMTMPTEKDDIQSIINNLSIDKSFLDLSRQKERRNNTWMFQDVIVNNSFINLVGDNTLIPRQHFDGLIFIKHISMPSPLR